MPQNGHFVPDIAIVRKPIVMPNNSQLSLVSVLDHLLGGREAGPAARNGVFRRKVRNALTASRLPVDGKLPVLVALTHDSMVHALGCT